MRRRRQCLEEFICLLLICYSSWGAAGFSVSSPPPKQISRILPTRTIVSSSTPRRIFHLYSYQPNKQQRKEEEEEEEDWGNHWIRPSSARNDEDVLQFMLQENDSNAAKDDILYMDVCVDGALMQTGPLSQQIDQVLAQRLPDARSRRALVAQMTVQQVLRVVLQHSGLVSSTYNEGEEASWGTVEALRGPMNHPPEEPFDSWDALCQHWQPGQTLSFTLRQVPTKRRSVSLQTLRDSMNGPVKEEEDEDYDDEPPITTLAALKADHSRRVEQAPREIAAAPYTGRDTRGYRVLSARDIQEAQQYQEAAKESGMVHNVTRHVMHALVTHGCVLVEWTDAKDVETFARMWEQVETLMEDPDRVAQLPPLQKVSNATADAHIKVGFASYQEGQMQFLERRRRSDGVWLPPTVLPPHAPHHSNHTSALSRAFDRQAELGRALVQLVVAASTAEVCGGGKDATEGAVLLARNWVDDGHTNWLGPSPEVEDDDDHPTAVSASPQRLCRYQVFGTEDHATTGELFGAHTDSSFLTAVPVAAVAGLEVYDEEAEQWYRPEAAAWNHYTSTQGDNDTAIPWYARYGVFMAGEWLQLVSGNQVPAAVHRVIAANRTSAPVLLRARAKERFDTERYFGVDPTNPEIWPVWKECQGRQLSEIHQALQ